MQTETPEQTGGRDVGGMVVAMVFIAIGTFALWDTTTMADADSYVFPRAIAGAMIVFSIMLIVWNLLRAVPGNGQAIPGASTPRRVGLVAAMLGSATLMPFVGFVLSGLAAFGLVMWFAMYDPWTRRRKILFPLVGVAIVFGFYVLFSRVLLVPLPTGMLFD